MSEEPARDETKSEGQETPERSSTERPKRARQTSRSEQGEQRQRRTPRTDSEEQRSSPRSSEDKPQQSGGDRPQAASNDRGRSGDQRKEPSEQRSSARLTARKAAGAALEQLQELTTRTPESVVGVERAEDGWAVTIEVVESRRIPDTADIMAEYEVKLDSHGEMVSYARGSRYSRGRSRDE